MKKAYWLAFMALGIASLACSMVGTSGISPEIEETRVALAVQQTSVAIQQMTLDAGNANPKSVDALPTYTPYPTYTMSAEDAVAPPVSDIKDKIKASNILIFEDVAGTTDLVPIVTNVINMMNFSGGKIINTSDALGDFKAQATSSTQWDLMIVAAEVRSSFSGEMFEAMYDHVNNGGAVIIETWYLDKVGTGKIAPILSKCGVRLFRDWARDTNYDPFKYSITWLDSSHPLLSMPNNVLAPSYPYPEWFGDAGDLLELGPSGDAQMIGGLYQNRKSDYGVLASCLGGRMVIQTFSTHDYEMEIVQPLWENYITYTLMNHYEYVP